VTGGFISSASTNPHASKRRLGQPAIGDLDLADTDPESIILARVHDEIRQQGRTFADVSCFNDAKVRLDRP
jgi:hypothetical protein